MMLICNKSRAGHEEAMQQPTGQIYRSIYFMCICGFSLINYFNTNKCIRSNIIVQVKTCLIPNFDTVTLKKIHFLVRVVQKQRTFRTPAISQKYIKHYKLELFIHSKDYED